MPAITGPLLKSPTAGFSRLDRVKLAVEFMRTPLGQRIKNALINRLKRANQVAGLSVESLVSGSFDLHEAMDLLAESPPNLAPGQGMPDPRLADLASGAIDLQPEDGPTLDDIYDSAILRINAADALDFFVASDIEQDLGAFMLFFDPQMPVQQAAQLLQSLKEIMPGTQIVQGPLAGPPPGEEPAAAVGEEPGDEEPAAGPDEEEPEAGDEETPPEEPEQDAAFPDQEEPGVAAAGEPSPDDEEEPEDDDEEDDEEDDEGEDDEDEEDELESMRSFLEAEAPDEMDDAPPQDATVPTAQPQFDTENPQALPWVFLVTSDEVNLAADGSVTPPEAEPPKKGIQGFPPPGEEPQAKPGEKPAAGEEPPNGEEPEAGEEEPGDEEEPPPGEEPAEEPAAVTKNEPGDQPGIGKEPGAGEMPGAGELPGPAPDDTPGDEEPGDEEPGDEEPPEELPPDEEPPGEEEPGDEEEPDDDDEDDEDEEENDEPSASEPGILFDSVTALLGEPPK